MPDGGVLRTLDIDCFANLDQGGAVQHNPVISGGAQSCAIAYDCGATAFAIQHFCKGEVRPNRGAAIGTGLRIGHLGQRASRSSAIRLVVWVREDAFRG